MAEAIKEQKAWSQRFRHLMATGLDAEAAELEAKQEAQARKHKEERERRKHEPYFKRQRQGDWEFARLGGEEEEFWERFSAEVRDDDYVETLKAAWEKEEREERRRREKRAPQRGRRRRLTGETTLGSFIDGAGGDDDDGE